MTVGGDHSIASGTIHGALRMYSDLKVIWVDAHADFVDYSSTGRNSHNYHGLPLAHISGLINLPN